MKHPPLVRKPTATVVHSPTLAKVILNRSQLALLKAFMSDRGKSIKEVSEELNLDLNSIYKKVARFEKLGLVEIASEKQRRGRNIKLYRCISEVFFIPRQTYSLEEHFNNISQSFIRALHINYHRVYETSHRSVGGILAGNIMGAYYVIADGEMKPFYDFDADAASAVFQYKPILLNQEDARSLEKELVDIFQKYQNLEGNREYMLANFLFPVYLPLPIEN